MALGRIVDAEDTLYIGHSSIRDADGTMLVINWKLGAAKPFFNASPQDPHGLISKRTFEFDGHNVVDFEETVFAALARQIEALDAKADEPLQKGPDAALLRELNRKRSGEMREIVRTIQAAQYDLITAPMDQVLVIQGGPGTGKTAILMHRVSWLLFNNQSRLPAHEVLVVGPNTTFTRYIKGLLPSLGDHDVKHLSINRLAPAVPIGRTDTPEAARLKGEARLSKLLRIALATRINPPSSAMLTTVRGNNRQVRLDLEKVTEAFNSTLRQQGPYNVRRRSLRDRVKTLIQHADRRLTPSALGTAAADLTDRIWPRLAATDLVGELFAAPDRLKTPASEDFNAEELALLHRGSRKGPGDETWSEADLALLDEADALLNGTPQRYGLIVVDEAQDLSAMQLRSIARRSSSGAITLVGDIAQSTGAAARDNWSDVLAHLPRKHPHQVEDLKYGYRVPRQVYEFAAPLLATAAPGVAQPTVVRDAPADPGRHHVTPARRAAATVEIAQAHAGKGRFVGIVCAESCRQELEQALTEQEVAWMDADQGELGSSINVVSPRGAKGLEFDSVIVVEPAHIAREDPRGERLLYIALTRTTKFLDVVYADPNVPPLDLPNQAPVLEPAESAELPASTPVIRPRLARSGPSQADPLVEPIAQALAQEFQETVYCTVNEGIYMQVLKRVSELLSKETEETRDQRG
ncbi:hypothetical protein DKT69_23240 [Micromonospora sicca]|uniref:UvrD-like helicase ATP-binding domain-containing protein n=1 Tax=Micromonospora sicca TaxID=2202420 RepID=A0A317DIN8_9ACTN|nr:UvrD-helicase domain-containing protein [Micromonospora sp. 4G51]PWR12673.1 hypothetical protein DKT69_23240 [Micromonospora sp. 4G51]